MNNQNFIFQKVAQDEKSINDKENSKSRKNKQGDQYLKLPDASAQDICSSLTTSTSNVYCSDTSISKM